MSEKYSDLKTAKLISIDKDFWKYAFQQYEFPWQILKDLSQHIIAYQKTLAKDDYYIIKESIYVHRSVNIPETCIFENGPVVIEKNTQIKPNAYIRESVYVGEDSVIGFSCELKNVFFSKECSVPHLSYVGDSIFGQRVHLGAGVICSNVRQDKKRVLITLSKDDRIDSNLEKFSSVIGDDVEIGCNCVLNPGTILAKNTYIRPLQSVKAYMHS